MVFTVTLNPALDYAVRVERFCEGETLRAVGETLKPGGKGLNVAAVLGNFGIPVRALGFVAGFTGDAIVAMARSSGVETDMIRVEGLSRINIKLKAGKETEINGRGAEITPDALEALAQKLRAVSDGSILVLAGTLPPSLPANYYAQLMRMLSDRDVAVVVDATGEQLRSVLPYRPYLVKPNARELGELFGVELRDRADFVRRARELRELGARNVIVSLGGEGALMATEGGEIFETPAPVGRVVDSVGAGDSLVAGFLAAKIRGETDRVAFLTGVAAGSATAFGEGLATEAQTRALLAQIR